jgi:GDP-D-mannose 3',5'-epimerase
MRSNIHLLNPGTEDMMSINQLARFIIEAPDTPDITIRHIDRLQAARGRNSDNSRLRQVLGLKPAIPLEVGLPETYHAIEKQVNS